MHTSVVIRALKRQPRVFHRRRQHLHTFVGNSIKSISIWTTIIMDMELLRARLCSTSRISSGESIKCFSVTPPQWAMGPLRVQTLRSTTVRHRDGYVVHIETNMALFDYKWVSTILSQPMGFNPNLFDVLRTIHLVKPLVSESVKILSDLTHFKKMTPHFSIYFTALYLMQIFLFFPLYTLLCATPIAAC